MSHSNPALVRTAPSERWARIQERLRLLRLDKLTMTDIKMPSDVRADATRRYTEGVDQVIADLDALDGLRALEDVAELFAMTYGDA